MAARLLIVNADDFGLARDVNEGIVQACRRGILRATTLMANGAAFDHAVELARGTPELDVGCHLTLIGGRSVVRPEEALPTSVAGLLARIAAGWRSAAIEAELAAQVEKIQAAGLRPTHLDTHKHTHLMPAVLNAVVAVARRYEIPWIRKPFDLPLTAAAGAAPRGRRLVNRGLRGVQRRFERTLDEAGCRSTDAFAGFQITGDYRTAELITLIQALPPGVTELMTHPGRCGEELRALPTRLKESREAELEALTDPAVAAAAAAAGVEITSFARLTALGSDPDGPGLAR